MIFTNSADQLRAALDRTVDKEMAVEALLQTNSRDTAINGESPQFTSLANKEANAREATINSRDDQIQDKLTDAEEPIEIELLNY